jgi:hypothetical protein
MDEEPLVRKGFWMEDWRTPQLVKVDKLIKVPCAKKKGGYLTILSHENYKLKKQIIRKLLDKRMMYYSAKEGAFI